MIEAVRQAMIFCREVQHNSLRSITKFVEEKNDTEPVTLADYGSQVILCRTLAEHFPDDAVIAEEGGQQFMQVTTPELRSELVSLLTTLFDRNVSPQDITRWLDHGLDQTASRTWFIDPIDGTKGFVNMRHYAVGVALIEASQPTISIIGAPGYGDGISGDDDEGLIFYALAGKAYQLPFESGGEPKPISVSDRTENLRIVQSFEKKHASKGRMESVRAKAGMADATVYELDSMEKYALVANGDADAYLRLPNLEDSRPHLTWDHAPGVALVLAAGGKVTDVDGTPLDFSKGRTLPNRGILVSNGHIHDRLVEATQALLAEEAQN